VCDECCLELFYTERAHVRNLKVMQQLFYRPMINDPTIASPEFVKMLFPNIDDMVGVHSKSS
jgi:Rho guanine nucleotide exchange factor 12